MHFSGGTYNWTKKELWFTLEVHLHGNQILSSVHLHGHKRVWSQSLAETNLINSNWDTQWLAYLTEASKRPWAKTFRTGKPWLVYHQSARKTPKLSSLRHPKTKECAPKKGSLENIVYHFLRQLWLVLGVKLMEINSNLFSGSFQKERKDRLPVPRFS